MQKEIQNQGELANKEDIMEGPESSLDVCFIRSFYNGYEVGAPTTTSIITVITCHSFKSSLSKNCLGKQRYVVNEINLICRATCIASTSLLFARLSRVDNSSGKSN